MMAAFKVLKDVCNNFEIELQRVAGELFSAKIGETYEEIYANKLRDLSLFTSKARLLRAKPISNIREGIPATGIILNKRFYPHLLVLLLNRKHKLLSHFNFLPVTPQISEQTYDKDAVMSDYGETVTWKIVEKQFVKYLCQSHSVQELLNTPSHSLNGELVERKEKLINVYTAYKEHESTLKELDLLLKEKEDELATVRERWYDEVRQLREMKEGSSGVEDIDSSGPYYEKLSTLVHKLSLMRWLIGRLVTPRTRGYDWLRDPHGRLAALKRARQERTVQSFLQHS